MVQLSRYFGGSSVVNPASISLNGTEVLAKLSKTSEDWSDVWKVAGVGFSVVFLVLIILAVAIWVTGIVVNKMEIREKNKEIKEAEEKKVS
jgi:hypothetical protein